MPDYRLQRPCSSRQADGVLGFLQTQVTEIAGSDSWKTLEQIRSNVRKKRNANEFKWPREGRPDRIPSFGADNGGMFLQNKNWN